ncbi:hypothetical protein CRE_06856 [Caenorhabditis remanei]|uniref:BTB domain-containing protein n=1 Tax=Caenorhabditis remanei TaxID=31234 RepID=E3MZM1_CAERE|nr:hypothetical protein CRE_06856 [Caenorhabditis remanei]
MSSETIWYKSGARPVSSGNYTTVLEKRAKSGIAWEWMGRVDTSGQIDFTWKFYWDELRSQGVDDITGHITVSSTNNRFTATTINVKITEDNQEITKVVEGGYKSYNVYFEYFLTTHYAPVLEKPSDEEMFAPSEQNDSILVVEGKKLHVNKTFLSYHSEYFRALFSSNFKEGQMDEIPIGDVSYEDFALLLSNFYPIQVFPTDKTVEKLLELARRFLVSSATRSAEYHLLNVSRIKNEKMLWMADQYVMPTLLEKCIRRLDTTDKAKKMKQSEEFEKLSDKTKSIILYRLLDLI